MTNFPPTSLCERFGHMLLTDKQPEPNTSSLKLGELTPLVELSFSPEIKLIF